VGALTGAGTGAGLPANGTVSGPAHGCVPGKPGCLRVRSREHTNDRNRVKPCFWGQV
jgi:hypothetical protein